MRKTLLAVAIAGAFSLPSAVMAQAAAAASPHTVTGNLTLASDYRFRGISQTFGKPAVQGGIDYSHASGLYLGTWASNVYGGTNGSGYGVNYFNGNLELDVYGGYKFEIVKDVTLDVGLLQYIYPGARYGVATRDKYDNTELYVGASYKWFSAKYSHALSDYFGAKTNTLGGACGVDSAGIALPAGDSSCSSATPGGSKGSHYLDLNASFEVAPKLTLGMHLGSLKVKNYGMLNYTDYKLGLTYDLNGWMLGAAAVGSNAKSSVYRTVQTQGGGNIEVNDTKKSTLVVSVNKSF